MKQKWKSRNHIVEFISIFIAVISAFALNNWSENRKDKQAESKILQEILHGIEKDLEDVQLNIRGHKFGLKSTHFWRKIIKEETVNLDSITQYYSTLQEISFQFKILQDMKILNLEDWN